MAKGVLGNDPFQRGAARRDPPHPAVEQPKKRSPARSKGWKARTSSEDKAPARSPPGSDPAQAGPDAAPTVSAPTLSDAAFSVERKPGAEGVQSERAFIPASSQEKADLLNGIYRAARAALGFGNGPVDSYGEDAQLVRNLAPLADFLHDRYWRISTEGADKLPSGPCLLVANHAGALPIDGPMLRFALARHRPEPGARWLAEESILQLPLLGALLTRIGAVRASPENALKILSDGTQLIVFPEGTHAANKSFTRRYELKPFGRGGFVKIAARARVPIVPVAIVGAGDALPVLVSLPIQSFGLPCLPLTLPPLPTKWSIRIGEPLDVNQVDPDDATEIARCTEWSRAKVQGMLQDILSSRKSIFSG